MRLKAESVCRHFTQGDQKIHALSHLNLSIDQEKSIAIVGQSGSGKSTLLGLLSGLDQPNSGDIWVLGSHLSQMSPQEATLFRAHHIGVVFQQFHLIPHLTALENVQLALDMVGDNESYEKATQILAQLNLQHRLHHFPHQMSGGENQRTAIARAIVRRPKIILADEPTGSLDPDIGQQVSDVLFETSETFDTTLILVTHNLQLAQRCEQIYTLSHGVVTKG